MMTQQVSREDSQVKIRAEVSDLPLSGTITFPEPVLMKAGETLIVELWWSAIPHSPFAISDEARFREDTTITTWFGGPLGREISAAARRAADA